MEVKPSPGPKTALKLPLLPIEPLSLLTSTRSALIPMIGKGIDNRVLAGKLSARFI